jgi:hypothetical protein
MSSALASFLVQAAQRGVEIGADQPVDDAAGEVTADGDLQARGFEGSLGRGDGGLACLRLAHQFDQWRRVRASQAEAGEADHVGPFVPFCSPVCTPRHSVPSSMATKGHAPVRRRQRKRHRRPCR